MKRFFRITGILALLGAGGFAAWYFLWPQVQYSAWAAVPHDAAVVVHSRDPLGAWKEIRDTKLWRHLLGNAMMADIEAQTRYLDSLLDNNETLFDLLGERALTFSIHKTQARSWDLLYIVDLENEGKLGVFEDVVKPILLAEGFTLGSSRYGGHKLLQLQDNETGGILYLGLANNLLLASYTQGLVKAAIDEQDNPVIRQKPAFKLVEAELGSRGMFQVWLQADALKRFLNIYSQTDLLGDMGRALDLAGLRLDLQDRAFELRGHLALRDSSGSYLHAVRESGTGRLRAAELAPQRTALYVGIQFGSYANLLKTFQNNLRRDVDGYDSYMRNKKQVEKLLKVDVERDLLSWMTDEVALVQAESKLPRQPHDQLLFLFARSQSEAREGLGRMLRQMKRSGLSPVKFKPVQYKEFTLFKFHVKGFFRVFLGNLFKGFETPYFTYLEDAVVMATSQDALQHYLDDYLEEKTLANSEEYADFQRQFSRTSNVFVYLNSARFFPAFEGLLDLDSWRRMHQNREYWTALRHVGLQLVGSSSLFDLNLRLAYDPAQLQDHSLYGRLEGQMREDEGTDLPEDSLSIEAGLLPDGYYAPTYPDGTPKAKAFVYKGQFEGDYRDYYKNGNLRSQGEYRQGQKVGKWYYYRRDGRLRESVVHLERLLDSLNTETDETTEDEPAF